MANCIEQFKRESRMLIRKIILPGVGLIVALLFFASAMAANKSNFTGTWVRNAASSDIFTAVLVPIIGPKRNSPGNNFLLRISHRDKRLQVTVEQAAQKPILADYDLGRGWHSSIGGRLEYEFGGTRYRSRWKSSALVIEKYASYRGNFGTAGAHVEQEWILSPGGDILTIKTTIDRFTTNEVFDRK